MTPDELEIRKKCKSDFLYYAPRALKIRTKDEGIKPFTLNEAQLYAHERAEKQLKEKGRVRMVVLKGRQQGCSTYVGGRFYWKVTHQRGVRAYILTHDSEATSNLFDMTARYHVNNNILLKPSTDKDSGSELHFDKLDSGYKVGTAGSKGAGRSQTIQYFHGSEVAFWPNAEKHARGAMQAVPDGAGEIWLESTSDGVGNFFYQQCMDALRGKSDYELLFIPWFWQSEYRADLPEDFELLPDEIQYIELVKTAHDYDMDHEQIMFRRKKIAELGGEPDAFRREYPATVDEAFSSSGHKQFISSELVDEAMKPKGINGYGPRVMGVDPARFGDDSTVISERQGRLGRVMWKGDKLDAVQLAGKIKSYLDETRYDAVFIDSGMGTGVIDILHSWGYDEVREVNFGGKALNPDKYVNKRNEMWGEYKEWLGDNVELYYDEELKIDSCSPEYKMDMQNRAVLEPKDKTKERLGHSPDAADSFILTFAEPVQIYDYDEPSRHDGRSSVTGY